MTPTFASRERPLIAISGELALEPAHAFTLRTRYAEAIERAGGIPLGLLPLEGGALDALLNGVDGVLLSGGDDFDARALGLGATHPAAKPVPAAKQAFDVALARTLATRALPVLGICYGMQLLGLVAGGGLHQHLPEDRPGCHSHAAGVRHAVRPVPGTKLARIVGVAELEVVSRHHQALASVSAPWRVAGHDTEGLIEAIEHMHHPFAVGVQWHPELANADATGDAELFRAFVAAARDHARARGLRAPATPAAAGTRAQEALSS